MILLQYATLNNQHLFHSSEFTLGSFIFKYITNFETENGVQNGRGEKV